MTQNEKRIKIAEACGWVPAPFSQNVWTKDPSGLHGPYSQEVPDYFNDLNACHEMEKLIPDEMYAGEDDSFNCRLWLILERDHPELEHYRMVSATAAQRAEAFGLTLGLWT